MLTSNETNQWLRYILTAVALLFFTAACSQAPSESPTSQPPTSTIAPTDIPPTLSADPFQEARELMVATGIVDLGVSDESVLMAMRRVPRHEFVPPQFLDQAYDNHPLPIGFGQTISQPYIVALMTAAVALEPDDVVLEVGTGSGYQAAVLAELTAEVYSIEIVAPLVERASKTLAALGYENIQIRHADGYFGWEEMAPFDAIVVTAAPDHVPQTLVQQLKIGGRMVIPVGPIGGVQTLWLLTKSGENEISSENLGLVRFVPFTREDGA